jgi:hypothetical protein
MAYNVCDELNWTINREPSVSDARKLYEYKLNWHLAFQDNSDCVRGIVIVYVVYIGYVIEARRNFYYMTQAKVLQHASGGIGSVFQPHMMSMKKQSRNVISC